MHKPKLLDDGRLLVPRRAEEKGIVGDGLIAIDSSDREFEAWVEQLSSRDRARLRAMQRTPRQSP